jgi:hypothetical protein
MKKNQFWINGIQAIDPALEQGSNLRTAKFGFTFTFAFIAKYKLNVIVT